MNERSRKSAHRDAGISPARWAAFQILNRVEEGGAYASVLLANRDELSGADHALAQDIVLGVLRNRLWIDSIIESFTKRPPERLDGAVRQSLRMGVYQLRFLDRIPARAVVDESVKLTYAAKVHSASGLVNAVLRRASREPDFDPAAGIEDPVQKLSISTSHPRWLIENWIEQFGYPETESFAKANNCRSPVSIRVAAGQLTDSVIDELRSAGAQVERSVVAEGAFRVTGGSQVLLRQASAGRIYIQDEASQLAGLLVAGFNSRNYLDCCAAPGSKSTLIASVRPESTIVAGDLRPGRVSVIRRSASAQKLTNIRTLVMDAARPPFPDGVFGAVLADLPCTGTGTLRRNPEIRWRITKGDISTAAARQLRILRGIAATVRPGGCLLYSTCSVEKSENEEVVNQFLSLESEFAPVMPSNSSQPVSNRGYIRTWPHKQGSDGFFMAMLGRKTA